MTDTPPGNPTSLSLYANAGAGGLVVGIGFWLIWREWLAVTVVLLAVVAFLVWVGRSLARIWAWATLLVGVESFSWPIITMVRVHLGTGDPTDQQMAEILNALLFGLFFAIFWTSFSYGIFSWARRQETSGTASDSVDTRQHQPGKGRRPSNRRPV